MNSDKKISFQEVLSSLEKILNNKLFNLIIFGIAILILVLFFFYISVFFGSKTYRGLGIMASALVMLLVLEYAIVKKKNYSRDQSLMDFKSQLKTYYRTRKYMHFIVTPLWLAVYSYGFTMLLSFIEKERLGKFYVCIIYLSWAVFFGLAVLIRVQLRKELEILKLLITDSKIS
ncbi:hypothetical protein DET49_1132 [Salegentibacter sp. 24]|uniref:hypothetical protein n=1 Tax=Salegentibacter sp. 24 TaxID=2183986 RepID=UPI00105BF630|nr:hypothetical protein [Salegentibacter sp. 24]TDN87143.1 hypothetical protein DET49_1132 [Salegentibacter sp. 24]